MARYGRQPVTVPDGVTVSVGKNKVSIKGPKGEIERETPKTVEVSLKENEINVAPVGNSKQAMAMQGTMRSLITNMIIGVTEGWSKTLEIIGAGYRAEVNGKQLVLSVGYSHPVTFDAPEGITFKVEKSIITVEGADRETVGLLAANIRKARKPNVYTGSGIKYTDEVIRRKAGKQASGATE